jgi:hypothetical protein
MEREIDTLIMQGGLAELAVPNTDDEAGQQAIQEKYWFCKIDWGYMP